MVLNRLVICDDTWVRMFEPETTHQSSVETFFFSFPYQNHFDEISAKEFS